MWIQYSIFDFSSMWGCEKTASVHKINNRATQNSSNSKRADLHTIRCLGANFTLERWRRYRGHWEEGSPRVTNSAHPKRQRAVAAEKRAHPVVPLTDLSANEINKEPADFSCKQTAHLSSTTTWKLVSTESATLSCLGSGGLCRREPERSSYMAENDSWVS